MPILSFAKGKKDKQVKPWFEKGTFELLATRPSDWAKWPADVHSFFRIREKIEISTKLVQRTGWVPIPYLTWGEKSKISTILVRMGIEPMTLALLAPRSADWANGPVDAFSFFGIREKRKASTTLVRKGYLWAISNSVFLLSQVTSWCPFFLSHQGKEQNKYNIGPYGDRTHDLSVISTTLYLLS